MDPELPRAILFDLDDTLIVFDGVSQPAWREVCARHAARAGRPAEELHRAISEVARAYWSDPERHRAGRLALEETRAALVVEALRGLGLSDAALARSVADDYSELRDRLIAPFPDAFATLEALRVAGVRMALVTNGQSVLQRRKIERFGLERWMAGCLVEEELGFGKPDRRVFEQGLRLLGVSPAEAWCVGDNLVWDVAGAQALGMAGIWKDNRRRGVPEGGVRPDRTIFDLAELLQPAPPGGARSPRPAPPRA